MMVATSICCQQPEIYAHLLVKLCQATCFASFGFKIVLPHLFYACTSTDTECRSQIEREGELHLWDQKKGYFTKLRSERKGRKCCTAYFLWKMSQKTCLSVPFNCYTRLSVASWPPCCFLFQSGLTRAPSTARLAVHRPPGGLLIGPGCCGVSAWAKENATAFFFFVSLVAPILIIFQYIFISCRNRQDHVSRGEILL